MPLLCFYISIIYRSPKMKQLARDTHITTPPSFRCQPHMAPARLSGHYCRDDAARRVQLGELIRQDIHRIQRIGARGACAMMARCRGRLKLHIGARHDTRKPPLHFLFRAIVTAINLRTARTAPVGQLSAQNDALVYGRHAAGRLHFVNTDFLASQRHEAANIGAYQCARKPNAHAGVCGLMPLRVRAEMPPPGRTPTPAQPAHFR